MVLPCNIKECLRERGGGGQGVRCGVVMLQEETLLSFSTGKVKDEVGEHRVEIPLVGTWGWEVVTRWPCLHPLSASHHPATAS